jgi:tripartite-type tricarboxylate transporter receptor subunit TctC
VGTSPLIQSRMPRRWLHHVAGRSAAGEQPLFSIPRSLTTRLADFMPISLIGIYANLLVVPELVGVEDVHRVPNPAKANPSKVTFASPGVGTTPYLAAELLKHKAGIALAHAAYRGVAAGGMSDLIAGRVDCMFNTGSLLQAARGWPSARLAVTSAERVGTAAEFTTIAEMMSARL